MSFLGSLRTMTELTILLILPDQTQPVNNDSFVNNNLAILYDNCW